MKSSLRYSERTWGVRSLIAAAVVGAISLAGFHGTALADAQAIAEINAQLSALGKPLLAPGTPYAKPKDLAKALGNAITSGITSPYLSGTANPNINATRVIALIQVATNVLNGGNATEAAALEYIKSVFKAEAKLPSLNPTHYPAGALNSGTSVQDAIYAAVNGASMSSGSNWAILAKNVSGGKKFAEAIAEELYNRSYFGSPAISDIEAGTTSIVKTDKFFSTDILKVALSSTAATTSGSAGQNAIMRGAYLGDKAGVPYLIAAAIFSGQTLSNAYAQAVTALGTNLKVPQAQAAAYTAQQVVSATNAVSAGVAVKNALRTGTAGGTGYATYGPAPKNESFRMVKEIVGAATVAYPNATNQIVAYAVKSGTYVEAGKTKNWGVVGGGKAIESGIRFCDLISRAANSIFISGTTVSGASEAAAAIVEQAVYAAQDSAANLSNKDRNKVIAGLVATAVKVAYKVDTDAGKTKKQADVGALAGAAVGGVVAVTGTATNDAVKKPTDPYSAPGFNQAMLWAITNGALKAVKKDATAFETVTKAIAQAVGYITGFYGGQTNFTNLINGLKDAAVKTNTAVATPATIQAWITAAISAGAAGNPSYGAWGTRDTADNNYYETYWTAMNAPAGTMVTDISGL